jgi:hypothetical protein
MKRAQSRWKHSWPFRRPFSWAPVLGFSSGVASRPGCTSTANSSARAKACGAGCRGFLLVSAAPLLLLLLIGLAGLLKVARAAQAEVALQARLDVCAVRLALARAAILSRLTRANQGLRLTALGIYAARGAKAAGPVGAVLGGASEMVLLRMNHSLALYQEGERMRASAVELTGLACSAGRYSREPAWCLAQPSLAAALRREQALFPDVKGPLVHREGGRRLARFHCAGGRRLTGIELSGTSDLSKNDFSDHYVN